MRFRPRNRNEKKKMIFFLLLIRTAHKFGLRSPSMAFILHIRHISLTFANHSNHLRRDSAGWFVHRGHCDVVSYHIFGVECSLHQRMPRCNNKVKWKMQKLSDIMACGERVCEFVAYCKCILYVMTMLSAYAPNITHEDAHKTTSRKIGAVATADAAICQTAHLCVV